MSKRNSKNAKSITQKQIPKQKLKSNKNALPGLAAISLFLFILLIDLGAISVLPNFLLFKLRNPHISNQSSSK